MSYSHSLALSPSLPYSLSVATSHSAPHTMSLSLALSPSIPLSLNNNNNNTMQRFFYSPLCSMLYYAHYTEVTVCLPGQALPGCSSSGCKTAPLQFQVYSSVYANENNEIQPRGGVIKVPDSLLLQASSAVWTNN